MDKHVIPILCRNTYVDVIFPMKLNSYCISLDSLRLMETTYFAPRAIPPPSLHLPFLPHPSPLPPTRSPLPPRIPSPPRPPFPSPPHIPPSPRPTPPVRSSLTGSASRIGQHSRVMSGHPTGWRVTAVLLWPSE